MTKTLKKEELANVDFDALQGVNLVYDGDKPVAAIMSATFYTKLQGLITKVRVLMDKEQVKPASREMSGSDASALSYLAEFPEATDKEEVVNRLSEQVKNIGWELIGKGNGDRQAKEASDALKKWAEEKRKSIKNENND
jgi:hypothetical protein